MTQNIEFFVESPYEEIYPHPVPAKVMIPEWFRSLAPENFDIPGAKKGTMKSCPPTVDGMAAGYVIPIPGRVLVEATADRVDFHWQGARALISNHFDSQLVGTPFRDVFKFENPWHIKTPPGYSSLIMHPFNRGVGPYTMFTAIVDTDTYYAESINFPFQWHAFPFQGELSSGDPMVQVIPFKRDAWKMVVRASTESERQERFKESERIDTKRHFYQRFRRQKKSWQ